MAAAPVLWMTKGVPNLGRSYVILSLSFILCSFCVVTATRALWDARLSLDSARGRLSLFLLFFAVAIGGTTLAGASASFEIDAPMAIGLATGPGALFLMIMLVYFKWIGEPSDPRTSDWVNDVFREADKRLGRLTHRQWLAAPELKPFTALLGRDNGAFARNLLHSVLYHDGARMHEVSIHTLFVHLNTRVAKLQVIVGRADADSRLRARSYGSAAGGNTISYLFSGWSNAETVQVAKGTFIEDGAGLYTNDRLGMVELALLTEYSDPLDEDYFLVATHRFAAASASGVVALCSGAGDFENDTVTSWIASPSMCMVPGELPLAFSKLAPDGPESASIQTRRGGAAMEPVARWLKGLAAWLAKPPEARNSNPTGNTTQLYWAQAALLVADILKAVRCDLRSSAADVAGALAARSTMVRFAEERHVVLVLARHRSASVEGSEPEAGAAA